MLLQLFIVKYGNSMIICFSFCSDIRAFQIECVWRLTCGMEICGPYVADTNWMQKTTHSSKTGKGGQSSAIAITTRGLTIRGLNPGKRKIFLILWNSSELLWSPPNFLFSRKVCPFLRLKQQTNGFDPSSLPRDEGKEESSYISSALHNFVDRQEQL